MHPSTPLYGHKVVSAIALKCLLPLLSGYNKAASLSSTSSKLELACHAYSFMLLVSRQSMKLGLHNKDNKQIIYRSTNCDSCREVQKLQDCKSLSAKPRVQVSSLPMYTLAKNTRLSRLYEVKCNPQSRLQHIVNFWCQRDADSSFSVFSFPPTHQKIIVRTQHTSLIATSHTKVRGHIQLDVTTQQHAHTVLKDKSYSGLFY